MARGKKVDEADETADANWYREHLLENTVLGEQLSWMDRDPYEFWTEMMRQAKALPKFIRQMALENGVDASAKRHKDGKFYLRAYVYDRKLKGYVRNPLLVAQDEAREAEVRERRSKIKIVKSGEETQ